MRSVTCGGVPSAACPLENVRRKSWSVQGATFSSFASNASLHFDHPENVVSAFPRAGKSTPLNEGHFSRIFFVMGPNGNVCCRPFLVIAGGRVIVLSLKSI